jgi:methionine-rich copper-binding protein CopC
MLTTHTSRHRLIRRSITAATLGALALLVTPSAASAHAELVRTSPANGAVLDTAPRAVALTFSEPVDVNSARIIDSHGTRVPSTSTYRGSTLTVRPRATLPDGLYTTTWHVTADDGHRESGAISFIVGTPSASGASQAIATTPKVATTLSGSHPGPLTVTMTNPASRGEVVWTSTALREPITWGVRSKGGKATAAGILPLPGEWTMTATLTGKGGTVVVVKGTATITS